MNEGNSAGIVILVVVGVIVLAVALCAFSGNVRLIADPEASARGAVIREGAPATATAVAINAVVEATAAQARVEAVATREYAAAQSVATQSAATAQWAAVGVAERQAISPQIVESGQRVQTALGWSAAALAVAGSAALAVLALAGSVALSRVALGRARIAARWLPVARRGNADLPMLIGEWQRIMPEHGEQVALRAPREPNAMLEDTRRAAWLARIESEPPTTAVLPPPRG